MKKSGRKVTGVEDMPFYSSLTKVQAETGLDIPELLLLQVGFSADPASCECGYEWNVYDLILKSVHERKHDWDFYKRTKWGSPEFRSGPNTFGSGTMPGMDCPACNQPSGSLVATYYYGGYVYPVQDENR